MTLPPGAPGLPKSQAVSVSAPGIVLRAAPVRQFKGCCASRGFAVSRLSGVVALTPGAARRAATLASKKGCRFGHHPQTSAFPASPRTSSACAEERLSVVTPCRSSMAQANASTVNRTAMQECIVLLLAMLCDTNRHSNTKIKDRAPVLHCHGTAPLTASPTLSHS